MIISVPTSFIKYHKNYFLTTTHMHGNYSCALLRRQQLWPLEYTLARPSTIKEESNSGELSIHNYFC